MKRRYTLLVISIIGMLFFNIRNSNAQYCWSTDSSSYHMGFEKSDSVEFYKYWTTMQDINDTEASWTIYKDSAYAYKSQYAIATSEYNNLWMFSRCFKLKADTGYQLTFWYFIGMPDLPNQNLLVKIGNNHITSSMDSTLVNLTNISNNNYQKATIIFTVPKDTTYYFGWMPYGNYMIDDSYMFIDDIALQKYVCDSLKPKIVLSKKGICYNSGDSVKLEALVTNERQQIFNTYSWNNGLSLNSYLWVKTAGTYFVSVTNASGCKGKDSIVVPSFQLPVASITTSTSKNIIIGNDSLELFAENLSPTGIDTIKWRMENGDTIIRNYELGIRNIYAKEAGLYSVTITDTNRCKGKAYKSILYSNKAGICHNSGDSVHVDAGNGYTSYQWSYEGIRNYELGIRNLWADAPGYYIVTVTGANSFIAVDTINIADYQIPDITIETATGKDYLCGNDNLLLSINNNPDTMQLTYEWNGPGIMNPDTIGTGTELGIMYAKETGRYTVTCTNEERCVAIDSIHIFTSSGTPTLSLAAQGDINICNQGSAALKAQITGEPDSNFIFTWMPVNITGGPTYAAKDTGTYYFIITGKTTGCQYISPSLDITNKPKTPDICIVTVDPTSGKNGIVWQNNIEDRIAYYKIYKQNTFGIFESIGTSLNFINQINLHLPLALSFIDSLSDPVAKSALYEISAVDSCGNESGLSPYHETIHLSINLGINNYHNLIWNPYVGFNYTTFYIFRDTSQQTTIDLIDSIQSSLTAYTDTHPIEGKVNYYVIGVTPHHDVCLNYEKSNKTVYSYSNIVSTKAMGVNQLTIKKEQLTVYPNPVNSLLVVSYSLIEDANVSIRFYDITGREVDRIRNEEWRMENAGKHEIQFNTSGLESGVYFVKMNNEFVKFIKL